MLYKKNEAAIRKFIAKGIEAVKKTRTIMPMSSNRDTGYHTDFTETIRAILVSAARRRKSEERDKLIKRIIENPKNTNDIESLYNEAIKKGEIWDKTTHKKESQEIINLKMYLAVQRTKVSKNAKSGNCGETSCYAFLWLIKKLDNYNPYIERLIAEESSASDSPTHAFVVINRDPTTDISKITLWNKEAVIVDPWLTDAYGKNPCVYINQQYYDYNTGDFFSSENVGYESLSGKISESYYYLKNWTISLLQGGERSTLIQRLNQVRKHLNERQEKKNTLYNKKKLIPFNQEKVIEDLSIDDELDKLIENLK